MIQTRFFSSLVVVVAVVTTCILLGPLTAQAAEPVGSAPKAIAAPRYDQSAASEAWDSAYEPHWSVAPLLGFTTNGLNAGIGLRGGRTLANRVYIGGTFLYNLGTSTTYYPYSGYPYSGTSYATASASVSSSVFYGGPEGGYELELKYVTLRVYAGLGLVHTQVSYGSSAVAPGGAAASGSVSANGVALWPGASVLYALPGTQFFVGGDLRLVISTAGGTGYGITGDPALGFFAFAGMGFGS